MGKKLKNKSKVELLTIAYELCAARLNTGLMCGWPGKLGEIEDYEISDEQREDLVELIQEIAFWLREKASEMRHTKN